MTISRVIRFHEAGGPDVLRLDEINVPPPGPGELRLKVAAIGLNRADISVRQGNHQLPLPSGLGQEAAGIVEDVGADVAGFAPGDPVNLLPAIARLPFGTYAERIIAPAGAVVHQPATLSAVEAAALWAAYLTAYAPLVEIAKVTAGDTVLLSAASSSVGLAAIAIVRALGGIPIALTRERDKAQRLIALGAADVVVTGEEDTVARVKALTGGHGARVAFDPVAGPAMATLLACVATEGIFIHYGLLSREPTTLPLDVLTRNLTISGYALDIGRNVERRARAIGFIRDRLNARDIVPVVDRTFPLAKAAAAHRAMEDNRHIGKLVLIP